MSEVGVDHFPACPPRHSRPRRLLHNLPTLAIRCSVDLISTLCIDGNANCSRVQRRPLDGHAKAILAEFRITLVIPLLHSPLQISPSTVSMAATTRPPSLVYGPRFPIPLTLTFGQLLDHQAETRPDSPAVISHVQGCAVSFRRLRDRSIALATAMAEAGIEKGSLVGIISGTRYEYLEVSVLRSKSDRRR